MKQDLLPRGFQADTHRFYQRIIAPALDEFPAFSLPEPKTHTDMDAFLDSAARHTSGLLAFEARRAFALTLAGLFERQLRVWSREHFADWPAAVAGTAPFEELLKRAADLHKIDIDAGRLGATLLELFTLANVVRHGDGRSLDKLREDAQRFWAHMAIMQIKDAEAAKLLSESVQIQDEDIRLYVSAALRFWGLADREPMALVPALAQIP